MSIMSFEERGPWGRADWPGNCSGHVYRELFKRLQPKLFVDCMCGSNSGVEAARDMGITAYGLDLHSGFNCIRDSILLRIGRESDLVISHPPYASQVQYSGKIWGDAPHPDDLSQCSTDEEFMDKLQVVLLNQRDATRSGGVYSTILGDWRRNGLYSSYQAGAISRMPSEELLAVLIKAQHGTASGRRQYRPMQMPFISHEYVILWRKQEGPVYFLLAGLARAQAAALSGTWRAVVKSVLIALGGKATLAAIYARVAEGCPDRLARNKNWQAKVRQTLNSTPDYRSSERGVWALA